MDALQTLRNRMIVESSASNVIVKPISKKDYLDEYSYLEGRILKEALSTMSLNHRLRLEDIYHTGLEYKYTPIMCYKCTIDKELILAKEISKQYAAFEIECWEEDESPYKGVSYPEGEFIHLKRENGKFDHLLLLIGEQTYYAFAELS